MRQTQSLAAEEERGKANMSANVPALPTHVTSKRFIPKQREQRERAADDDLAREHQRRPNHVGTDPSMMMPPTPDDEQQPVGGRVEDLAELGHLVEVAGDVAVDPVGRAEDAEQPGGRRTVVLRRRAATGTAGCSSSRGHVITFGTVSTRVVARSKRSPPPGVEASLPPA